MRGFALGESFDRAIAQPTNNVITRTHSHEHPQTIHQPPPKAGPKLPPYGLGIHARASQEGRVRSSRARAREQLDDGDCDRRSGRAPRLSREDRSDASWQCRHRGVEGALRGDLQAADEKCFQEKEPRGGEGLLVLRLKDAIPVEGGLPILVDGKLIGALGVSGGSSAEDEVCAEAGAAALE